MGIFDLFKKTKQQKKNNIVARNPLNLQVGDIVEYDLVEYRVIGKIIYSEGGYRWYDYHISDGNKKLWLSAEQDDELEVGLYRKLPSSHELYSILQDSKPTKIAYEGDNYSLVEHGTAIITVEGQVGASTGQRVEYWEYASNEDDYISVALWGGHLEISIEEEVKQSLLNYYPAK